MRIRNFRCLEDVALETGPVNVLIGENGAGKSSILDAVLMLSDLVQAPWNAAFRPARRSAFPDLVRRGNPSGPVSLDFEFSAEEGEYGYYVELMLNGSSPVPAAGKEILSSLRDGRELMNLTNGIGNAFDVQARDYAPVHLGPEMLGIVGLGDVGKYPWAAEARNFWKAIRRFRFNPDAVRKPSRVDPSAEIEEDGTGLPAVFDNMDDDIRDAVNSYMAGEGPDIRRFVARAAYDGNKVIALHDLWSDRPFFPSQISDGTLRHLALVVLAHVGDSTPVVLVEEPENGLNPHRYAGLLELWRGAAQSGGPQFVMATHAISFVDYVKEGELFHVRKAKGASRATRVCDVPKFKERMEAFEGPLGEAWFAGVLDEGEGE